MTLPTPKCHSFPQVTWLEGHSLAQTVFTNLYLHSPHIIEDRALKAFTILVLRLVDVVRERISRASVFEEEDFQAATYGFKMAPDVTDLRALGMMKEVEEEAFRLSKVCAKSFLSNSLSGFLLVISFVWCR